jgi:hypothetical protein
LTGRGQTIYKNFDKFETPDASTVRMLFSADRHPARLSCLAEALFCRRISPMPLARTS